MAHNLVQLGLYTVSKKTSTLCSCSTKNKPMHGEFAQNVTSTALHNNTDIITLQQFGRQKEKANITNCYNKGCLQTCY